MGHARKKMDGKLTITFYYLLIVKVISCPIEDNSRVRVFTTLVQFQGNKLSFNPSDQDYLGSSVNFTFESLNHLLKNSFVARTSNYVTAINLSHKRIKMIDDGAFTELKCLYCLNLSNNLLSNLTMEMFSDLVNLRNLNLSRNVIKYFSNNTFGVLKELNTLDLSHNNIMEITQFIFQPNPSLEILKLSYNCLKRISYNFFSYFSNLKELYLDHNDIAILKTNWFSKNKSLQKLDFSGNGLVIFNIVPESFHPQNFKLFNLSNNDLMDLKDTDFITAFSNTRTIIDLNDNQFSCNLWQEYVKEFQKYNVSLAPGRNFSVTHNINGIVCDNLNYTHSYDNEMESLRQNNDSDDRENLVHTHMIKNHAHHKPLMSVKYVVIAFTLIGLAICAFMSIDYALGTAVRERLTYRVRFFISRAPNSDSNLDYVQLQSVS